MQNDSVIIIPVYNGLDLLVKCVDSIMDQTKNPKIIFVNDGSDEKTTHWINRQAPKGNCYIIHNKTALGFSAACNIGIEYAIKNFNFSVLCLLNSDTEIVTPDWFGKVQRAMMAEPNIAIGGVLSNNATHHSLPSLNGKIVLPFAHDNISNYIKKISENKSVYCNLISGFCYFIRKEIINILGPLDLSEFPHYGSEDDYSLKAVSIGFKNIIVDSVFVYHHECQSYGQKKRIQILQHSVPALKKRWTNEYVQICFQEACNALNYLKCKEKYPF